MQTKNIHWFRRLSKAFLKMTVVLSPLFIMSSVLAAGTGTVTGGLLLSSIASNVDTSVQELARVLSDISLIAGVGFVMASFFKFHQHKLNPTQVPISQGVTLLLIGAGLVLFPTMLPTAKNALFGSSAEIAKVGGKQINSIIGSGT